MNVTFIFTLGLTKDGAVPLDERIHTVQPWNKGLTHNMLSERPSDPEVNIRSDQCMELQL